MFDLIKKNMYFSKSSNPDLNIIILIFIANYQTVVFFFAFYIFYLLKLWFLSNFFIKLS